MAEPREISFAHAIFLGLISDEDVAEDADPFDVVAALEEEQGHPLYQPNQGTET